MILPELCCFGYTQSGDAAARRPDSVGLGEFAVSRFSQDEMQRGMMNSVESVEAAAAAAAAAETGVGLSCGLCAPNILTD